MHVDPWRTMWIFTTECLLQNPLYNNVGVVKQ